MNNSDLTDVSQDTYPTWKTRWIWPTIAKKKYTQCSYILKKLWEFDREVELVTSKSFSNEVAVRAVRNKPRRFAKCVKSKEALEEIVRDKRLPGQLRISRLCRPYFKQRRYVGKQTIVGWVSALCKFYLH